MTSRVFAGTALDHLLAEIDATLTSDWRPTLALAFASPDQDFDVLNRALTARGLETVCATTAGEIAGGTILEDSVAVMLWDAAPDSFEVWSEARGSDESMGDVAARLGAAAADRFAQPIVLAFASGVSTDGEAVVRGIAEGAGRALPLYGGLAGDNLLMIETRVAAAAGSLTDGLVGLVLDGDRYEVAGVATSGWEAIGVAKTVTRSEGNHVFELDGESVLDVYDDYFDLGGLRDSSVSIVMDLGVQYPLSVSRADGPDVLRAPLFSDPETGALIFAGTVPEGSRVRFCVPPSLDIAERVIAEAQTVRTQTSTADAVVLVSCKARHTALGPLADDEVRGLYDVWGAPMIGFFSYGEIGAQTDGACDFHNETCALLAVRERPA